MKQGIYTALLVVLNGILTLPTHAASDYVSPCRQVAEGYFPNYISVGYGEADNFQAAKQHALQDLAESLGESVISIRSEGVTRKKDTEVYREFHEEFSIQLRIKLDQAERICEDLDTPTTKVYVVYKVDRRTLQQKLADKLLNQWMRVPATIHWQGPRALVESRLVVSLTQLLTRNANQSNTIELPVALTRMHGRWYLEVDGEMEPIGQLGLLDLLNWEVMEEGQLVLELLKVEAGKAHQWASKRFKAGDEFKIAIKSGTKHQGYITLFNIYPDGRVAQLLPSSTLNASAVLPKEGVFISELLNSGEPVLDTYIALFSEKPLDVTVFRQLEADAGLVEGEMAYGLDRFVSWLDGVDAFAIKAIHVETTPH